MHTYLVNYQLTEQQSEPCVPLLIEAYDEEHAREQFAQQQPNGTITHLLLDD